ncbi:MAG: protein phosphatase 2C domain-containing protein [Verrucomicrobia bacterium]|nr:protein phosphatase 2C domain-containing protein [Verrucomicrobiota bacterium]
MSVPLPPKSSGMKLHHSGHALSRSEGAECDDAWIVRERRGALVAALADGVGASREGGVAARRAVEMLADHCLARPLAWSPRRALAEFTAQINRHLHSESLQRHGTPELVCTLAAVFLDGGRLHGCNVGDSSVFLRRGARLLRLSTTHTLAQPGLDHVLTRALGLAPDVEPHFFETELADGDLVVLCSDGLTTPLGEERLAALLAQRPTARSLVAAAREATAGKAELRDDTCAIVLDITERGAAHDGPGARLEVLPALRAGQLVTGHALVRPLASGHDRVWLAEEARGARVVLKFPPLEAAGSEVMRDAFVREAWNATRLASPDLVRAWTPGGADLQCYAMEFVDAPTLRAVLRFGRLGVEEARELAQFFLRVGQFLVRHDLAHGDLKPDNVLILRGAAGTTFRLLDLGSAAELVSVTSRAGTASYLAPERFRGGALSERTEIFAVGVTLYEALTGAYPYGEIEQFQTPRFDSLPRRVTKLNAAVPAWLEAVILRAIDPDPERRYQNFSEMAFDLANPARVAPHHRKDAPLIERNPLLYWKITCAALAALNLWLVARLLRH